MTMIRQIWLALLVSMLVALAGSLLATTLNARTYLVEQLTLKNSDNAAALALALSQQGPDPVTVELAVAALFDGGHYESIRVVDPADKVIVERKMAPLEIGVPGWFQRLLPIDAPPGRALISSGWSQFGEIILVSHARFAYRALWQSFIELMGGIALAGLVGGALASAVLHRLNRPLAAVVAQASAIAERRFATIPEPAVPELRKLAAAMNGTVVRLRELFAEEASRLDAVRREASVDAVTGLPNRAAFKAQLSARLTGDEAEGGSLLLVRLPGLADLNRRIGRELTDQVLTRYAEVISRIAEAEAGPAASVARLNGADFAVLLPFGYLPQGIAGVLPQRLRQCLPVNDAPAASSFIAYGRFEPNDDAGALLARVDAALAQVEASGMDEAVEAVDVHGSAPKSAEDWRILMLTALSMRQLKLKPFPVTDGKGQLLHVECPLRLGTPDGSQWLAAGHFMPMAERLGMTARFDLAAIELALNELTRTPDGPARAVNVSASSLGDAGFFSSLSDLLAARPEAAARLWIEMPERGVFARFAGFRHFVSTIRPFGCRLGVEHFGRQVAEIGRLNEVGLDYIKVDASLLQVVDGSPVNKDFLSGLCRIAHDLGLMVIAEGVADENDVHALVEAGFDGMTGPGIVVPGIS